jgi:AcrR family transcriptional regulator
VNAWDQAEACGALGKRHRNAAATRQSILDAARCCFAQEGYDQVGVREIAARAGVDPALVNRYFGSKEGLFAEAVKSKLDLGDLFAGERATLGERLARFILNKPASEAYDPLVALLRSSSSEVAASKLRDKLLYGFVKPVAARLDGPDALQRAELISATLLGLLVYRTVVGGSARHDPDRLVDVVAPLLQTLVDGPKSSRIDNEQGDE